MNKKILLFSSLLFLGISCKKDAVDTPDPIIGVVVDPVTTPTSNPPNILFIIADDIGVEATPGYPIGAIKPNMPNLERLAVEGITFDNVWAYPVCSPTRASILTGRTGFRTGVLNAEDASTMSLSETTLHSFLDQNTNSVYSHAILGKWHLSRNEPNRPTEMDVGHYAGLLGGGVADYNSWAFTQNGETNNSTEYITAKITDLAIEWISEQDKPWFCWVAYTAPHTPFHLPPTKMHSQGELPTDQDSIDNNPMPYFLAMTESVDFEMGRILQSIPADELENTTIIFLGDNGSHPRVIQAPFNRTKSKGSLYQGGLHVPLIVSGKSVSRVNARDQNLINSSDLFATIAEMAGVTLPSYQDSYSFNSLLTSGGQGQRTFNHSEVLNTNASKSGYTVRNLNYKLIVFDNGEEEFYDLIQDPYENANLLDNELSNDQQLALQTLQLKATEIRQ